MSRLLWLAAAASYGPPAPAPKPDTPEPITAEQAIATAQSYYSVAPPPKQPCPESTPDNIVVCPDVVQLKAKDFVVDSTGGPGDAPVAPNLEPKYGGVVVARGCFIPPCPRPMPVLIDLKTIPEAPEGSDADRIARGEIPGP